MKETIRFYVFRTRQDFEKANRNGRGTDEDYEAGSEGVFTRTVTRCGFLRVRFNNQYYAVRGGFRNPPHIYLDDPVVFSHGEWVSKQQADDEERRGL